MNLLNKYIKGHIYIILAYISLALGIIGAILPVMPTVPFIILAAYLASHSSPKLHQKILNFPKIGPIVRDWEEYQSIKPSAKMFSAFILISLSAFYALLSDRPTYLRVLVPIIMLSVLIFILTRPSAPPRATNKKLDPALDPTAETTNTIENSPKTATRKNKKSPHLTL